MSNTSLGRIRRAQSMLCKAYSAHLDKEIQRNRELGGYELWMVKSNLKTIASGEMTEEQIVGLLRANGYHRIAAAVEKALQS